MKNVENAAVNITLATGNYGNLNIDSMGPAYDLRSQQKPASQGPIR